MTFGFSRNHALGVTSLFFVLIFLFQAVAIAPSVWLISKKGLRFSVFWGNIFLVGFFSTLFLAKYDPIFFILAAAMGGIQIGLYWTAYHIYLAELTDDKKQGEEIAVGNSLSAVAVIGGPAFGGMIINYAGFEYVFLVMTVLVLLANIPLRYLPKDKDTISVDILKTAAALTPRKEFKSYLSIMGIGVIDTVAVNFWPIFVFSIVTGFIGLGFMGSLMALVSTVTTIALGFAIDRFGTKRVINVVSILDALIWVIRAFVVTPLQVFAISATQSLTTSGQIITIDSMIYKKARHQNLVGFILQREIGLSLGRAIFLLPLGILLWFGLPLMAVFFLAAIFALATRLYPAEELSVTENQKKEFKLPGWFKLTFKKPN